MASLLLLVSLHPVISGKSKGSYDISLFCVHISLFTDDISDDGSGESVGREDSDEASPQAAVNGGGYRVTLEWN